MSLMLSLFAITATCVPDAAAKQSGVETATSFFAAINANDTATLGRLVKPGARYKSPSQQIDFDLPETLGMLGANGALLKLIEARPGATPGEVIIVTQANTDPHQTGTLTIEGGCVTGIVQP